MRLKYFRLFEFFCFSSGSGFSLDNNVLDLIWIFYQWFTNLSMEWKTFSSSTVLPLSNRISGVLEIHLVSLNSFIIYRVHIAQTGSTICSWISESNLGRRGIFVLLLARALESLSCSYGLTIFDKVPSRTHDEFILQCTYQLHTPYLKKRRVSHHQCWCPPTVFKTAV